MPSPKILAAGLAVAVAAGLVPGVPGLIGGAKSDAAAALPPPPEVLEVPADDAPGPDDGYVRLIVTPILDGEASLAPPATTTPTPAATTLPTPTVAPAPTSLPSVTVPPETTATAVSAEPDATAEVAAGTVGGRAASQEKKATRNRAADQPPIDPAVLEQLTAGAVLVLDDQGRPWAEYPDGTLVALFHAPAPLPDIFARTPTATSEPQPTPEAASDPEPTVIAEPTGGPEPTPTSPAETAEGRAIMDVVATLDEVARVVAIGDGSYSVTLVDPSVLDGQPVRVVDDVPMTIAGEPAPAVTADPYEAYQWWSDNTGENLTTVADPAPDQVLDADLDAAAALDGASGTGVVVALVDTGVDLTHPDLTMAGWVNDDEECGNDIDDDQNGFVDDCTGWDFAHDDATPFDAGAHPHGTHLAGVIAAAHNGVGVAGLAPGVELMDLNVATTNADGRPGISAGTVARAIRYAVDNGAHVVNLSLAASAGSPVDAGAVVEHAIAYAGAHGVLVVVPAGNSGKDLDDTPTWPASYDLPNMITVGASTPSDGPAAFSNLGGGVDIFAPGEHIVSTATDVDEPYVFMSGTSQAAAMVSAAAALVLDRAPDLGPVELRDKLVASADRNDALTSAVTGGVRLNAANATGQGTPEYRLADVAIAVSGLTATADGSIDLTLDLAVPTDHFADPYRWEATLYTVVDDGVFALIGRPVAINGLAVSTDERGAVSLGQDGSGAVSWAAQLPTGRYRLAVEAVPLDEPTMRLGDPFAVGFVVGDVVDTTLAPPPDPADDGTADDEPADDDETADETADGTAGPEAVDPADLAQNQRHLRARLAEPFTLANGLDGIRVLADDPTTAAVGCVDDPCPLN